MSDIPIGTNQRLFHLNSLKMKMDSLTQELGSGKKIASPKDNPSAWKKASTSNAAFNHLQSINSSLNSIAMNIRVADTTMDTIGDNLDTMESHLEMMIKNYPYFPQDSPERAELINNYNALRTQIDQMTMPSKDEGAKKIMSDPSVVSDAGDWEIMVGESNAKKTIHSWQVHTGPTGLNIPELPENATDSEILEAIANIKAARDTLEQRRMGLAKDAAGIARWVERNIKTANFHRERAEKIENADMNELAAQIMSVELRHSLSIELIRSIAETQSQLITLFG